MLRLSMDSPSMLGFHVPITASTNDDAKRFLTKRNDEIRGGVRQRQSYLFIADRQTSGRGRGGRRFNSDDGTLTFSLAFHRTIASVIDAPWMVAATAVADGVRRSIDHQSIDRQSINHCGTVKIKPPNDVLLDDKKVAGILMETVQSENQPWMIIGVGINISSVPVLTDDRPLDAPPPGCLAATGLRRGTVLYQVVSTMRSRFKLDSPHDSSGNSVCDTMPS